MGHVGGCHSVRPLNDVCTLGGEEDEDMADEKEVNIEESKTDKKAIIEKEGEEKEEEARNIRGKKPIRQPSQEEYDEHMRTHMPFRKWCPHCVQEMVTHTRHHWKRRTRRFRRCRGIIWSREEKMEKC
jgi:hypothetical protein